MTKFLNNLSNKFADRYPKSYRVAKQVFREFWFPFVIALCWAFYRVPLSQSDFIAAFIAQLATSFFLISWGIGQLVRISRQHKVETRFKDWSKNGLDVRNCRALDCRDRRNAEAIGRTTLCRNSDREHTSGGS